jgi:hypothetical protein
LLGCYRTEDEAQSPFLREFLNPSAQRNVGLDALTHVEALKMADELLSQRGVIDAKRSAAYAQASYGSPVFLEILAQHAPPAGDTITFENVVVDRVRLLPEVARRLLETVAVAACPILIEEWHSAAEYDGTDGRALEELLHAERFIRSSGPARASRIEIYHDRIRKSILNGLAPENLRQHHHHLALALRKAHAAGTDAEVLAFHLEGAEEYAEASRYYGVAADGAARDLAFDRAAELYRRAIRLSPPDVAEDRPHY